MYTVGTTNDWRKRTYKLIFPGQTDTHTDRPNYCNPRSRMRRGLIIFKHIRENASTQKLLYTCITENNYHIDSHAAFMITTCACAKGQSSRFCIVVVSTKIARSRILGDFASANCSDGQTVSKIERKRAYVRQGCPKGSC